MALNIIEKSHEELAKQPAPLQNTEPLVQTRGRVATLDANEAVATVAYALSEVIAIYPITPSSAMGEWADQWASEGRPNLWGTVPAVIEMQSEGGAAGAVHGALQTGSLATTFTASQGLMLMLPNMYKIAGELTPTVFHVAARSLAAQALSIFGDHQDVMAARTTGWSLLCSNSVQEAQDFALIAHAATLESRIPVVHFFDGFRTSHEVQKIELLPEGAMRAMISQELVAEHHARGLSPEHPVIRGTAQNPDVYFQGRESGNPYYEACPSIVQRAMDRFAAITGRQYHLYEYYGAPDAERVVVLMGSGAEAVQEAIDYLNKTGERVGVLKVRLFRPFDSARFVEALPPTVRSIAVLDRTKEPGASGEPLYVDCVTAIHESWESTHTSAAMPRVVGGRYGLSSKEFTPAMVRAVFENLAQPAPRRHFTVGITDDVTHTSLDYDPTFSTEPLGTFRAVFYGLGSDGTVGANKNSIKIIGEETDLYAQGYFVYDSKKSGAVTVSHLRFGPTPIHSTYLITQPNFVACHQPIFLERYAEDMLAGVQDGGTFLLNTPYAPDRVWSYLPRVMQQHIVEKRLRFYAIDAYKVARKAGMPRQINTVMQTCFFAISGVLPRHEALYQIEKAIRKSYGRKGEAVVQKNLQAVSQTLENLHEVEVPSEMDANSDTTGIEIGPPIHGNAPRFVVNVLGPMIAGHGDQLPVSALPVDGTYPVATTQYEKRNLALEIPVWDPEVCIQCAKCVLVCPHAAIRAKVYDPQELEGAPDLFKWTSAREREWQTQLFTIQVAPEDCTGCGICVDVCPALDKRAQRAAHPGPIAQTRAAANTGVPKAINMQPQPPLRETERANWEFFTSIPDRDRRDINTARIRQQQVERPLFEFSFACAGCGETPYIKLLTQLFGDRMVVANATGCSSIYGGNLPTTPWSKNDQGRGPAWANSLFEDNAEFGLGFRVSLDKQAQYASELLHMLGAEVGEELVDAILGADQHDEAGIYAQRERVAALRERLAGIDSPAARQLERMADNLVRRSVWIIGGDGWAYDIGFGGLDHVLASGRNVNVLVLDTEVYSNTGGQASKSTPRSAVAKFASSGKTLAKKDLGLIAMTYGNIYVARVALGAQDEQTVKALLEAEAYDGPSLIIAYSHCIAHGIPDMALAMHDQKAAVDSGQWPLYRYNPAMAAQGRNPLQLDSRPPHIPVEEYLSMETRFNVLQKSRPAEAAVLHREVQQDVDTRWALYSYLAQQGRAPIGANGAGTPGTHKHVTKVKGVLRAE